MTPQPVPVCRRAVGAALAAASIAVLCLVGGGAAAAPSQTVHVASNGWHTGIIVARDALPEGRLPEAAALPPSPYLEIGWGDRGYFPKPDPGVLDALAAGLFPGPAAIHLVAVPAPPSDAYRDAEVVGLELAADGFAALIAALDADVVRPADGAAAPLAPGLHPGRSLFFPAHGRFHAFNTCNTWTAARLRAAGLAVDPAGVQTADAVMAQLRRLAEARGGSAAAP